MKVLVATARTQGDRENDYHWCVEGELVRIDVPCARDAADPDGGCGCGRGFAGLASHRATTTAAVADLRLSRVQYAKVLRSSLIDQGWRTTGYREEADGLLQLAAEIPLGTVIGRRLWELPVRHLPTPETAG